LVRLTERDLNRPPIQAGCSARNARHRVVELVVDEAADHQDLAALDAHRIAHRALVGDQLAVPAVPLAMVEFSNSSFMRMVLPSPMVGVMRA